MNTSSRDRYRFSFAIFDLFSLNIVHFVLMLLMEAVPGSKEYFLLFLVHNIAWIVCAYVTALYIGKHESNDQFFRMSVISFLLFLGMSLMAIFLSNFSYSRLFVILVYMSFGTIFLISRMLYVGAGYYMSKQDVFNKKVIVIGYNELAKGLVENFGRYNKSISIMGYFEDKDFDAEVSNVPILGGINDSVSYAIKNHVTEIYSTISPEKNSFIYDLAQEAEINFIRFKFVPDFRLFINRKIHVDFSRNIPILSLRPEPLENLDSRITKRCFDIAFSIIVIFVFLSWLIPLIAILIKIDSRGPVFFTQLRSGKNNSPFLCYKFRSLRVNKDADNQQVTMNDTRFTRLGKFLRKTNIDELPQFINVLRGEMSVVGPRPHMLKHTEEYSKMLNHYMIRHFVKPGVTGWAQINGYRGEIKKKKDLLGRIDYDIWYMENWSMWLDLKIILLTLYKSLRGDENAY